MEIVSGDRKGHPLSFVSTPTLRPTSAKVRDALFNIVAARRPLAGMRVLDLYCGVGALGLEALSRGAAFCVFVDRGSQAIKLTKENIARLKFEDRARVIKESAVRAVEALAEEGMTFDLVIADPHYSIDEREVQELAASVRRVLAPDGFFVLEHSSRTSFDLEGWETAVSKRYGDTSLTFYVLEGAV